MKNTDMQDTPLYGRILIRFTRPFPNFDFGFIKPIRKKAVTSLLLRAGDRVLDVGCGPGGSFPFLIEAVGTEGSVVGIEISSLHSSLARDRIDANGWHNVEVITAPASESTLEGSFKGLLMFAAPDVYGSERELENILPALSPDARIAAFGAKLATNGLGRCFNPVIKALYKLSFSTTPPPEPEPWLILTKHLDDVVIDNYFFGLMFLVSGRLTDALVGSRDRNPPARTDGGTGMGM